MLLYLTKLHPVSNYVKLLSDFFLKKAKIWVINLSQCVKSLLEMSESHMGLSGLVNLPANVTGRQCLMVKVFAWLPMWETW